MTLVGEDRSYRVVFQLWRCRCGKQAVTTGSYSRPPTCDCRRPRP